MKYIRTKSGEIYLVNKDLFEEDVFHFTNGNGIATISIEEKNLSILGKQSDTIEELCDEFVRIDNEFNRKDFLKFDSKRKQYWFKNDDKSEPPLDIESTDTIYGCIWTDKGLIYVAKMNEKGEMELL